MNCEGGRGKDTDCSIDRQESAPACLVLVPMVWWFQVVAGRLL